MKQAKKHRNRSKTERSRTPLHKKKSVSKRHKRSSIDKEIDAELYQSIVENAEEIIMPTHLKKYFGCITKRRDKMTPTWRTIFGKDGIPSRSFYAREDALAYILLINKQQSWPVRNIIYKADGSYYCALTAGQMMKFSPENMDVVEKHVWNAHYYKSVKSYYASTVVKGKEIQFHRMVTSPGLLTTDHINRTILDNSLYNLRIATRTTQAINRKISSKNKTGVTKLYFDVKGNRYRVGWRTVDKRTASRSFRVRNGNKQAAHQEASQFIKDYVHELPHYRLALHNQ